MAKKQLKTMGELRDFLAEVLVDVRANKIDTDSARNVVKVAAQITENFYSELKSRTLALELGEKPLAQGRAPLGDSERVG